ncbi:hypothetical protein QL285_013053 [Trifolium repens]|nr:hypothetical protein QL285_013053 [Trifolium repens]
MEKYQYYAELIGEEQAGDGKSSKDDELDAIGEVNASANSGMAGILGAEGKNDANNEGGKGKGAEKDDMKKGKKRRYLEERKVAGKKAKNDAPGQAGGNK